MSVGDVDEVLQEMQEQGVKRTVAEIMVQTAEYRHRRATLALEVIRSARFDNTAEDISKAASDVLLDYFMSEKNNKWLLAEVEALWAVVAESERETFTSTASQDLLSIASDYRAARKAAKEQEKA